MVLHVKDADTDALVRQLAEARGIGITEAIKEAVREALEADRSRAVRDHDQLLERLEPLFKRLDRLPRDDLKTDKAYFDALWEEGKD